MSGRARATWTLLQSLSRPGTVRGKRKRWLSAHNAGRTGHILATSTSSIPQWRVCVLLHLPHSGMALQSNLAQHSFPSRRSRWQGCGSVGWSAKTLNKLLKACRASAAFFLTRSGGPRAEGTSCCRGATRRSPRLRKSEPSELARPHGVHGDTSRAWALCTRRRDLASRQTVHSLDTFRNGRCILHS